MTTVATPDMLLCGALLRTGDLKVVLDERLDHEWLAPDARPIFEAIRDHFVQYGKVPAVESLALAMSDPNVVSRIPQEVPEPVAFYVHQLRVRHVARLIAEGNKAMVGGLRRGEPFEALEEAKRLLTSVHRLNLEEGRGVNVTEEGTALEAEYDRVKSLDGKLIGIPTPWPAMDKVTMGWLPGETSAIVARTGTGKCIQEDTPVHDPDSGLLRPVKDIVRFKTRVVSHGPDGWCVKEPVAWLSTGKKECLTVALSNGQSITVTPEHPFLTPTGWLPASELKSGSYVAAASGAPFAKNTIDIPDDDITIMAAMLADGSYCQDTLHFTKDDVVIVGMLDRALRSIGCRLKQQGKRFDYEFRSLERYAHNPFPDFLRKYGMDRVKSPKKRIPDAVFGLKREQLARFIGVLWSCDGCIDNRGSVTLGMSSRRLVYEVAHLLLRFDITSAIRHRFTRTSRESDRWFESWELRVNSTSAKSFVEQIPLFGKRAEQSRFVRESSYSTFNMIPLGPKDLEKLFELLRPDLDEEPFRSRRETIENKAGICESYLKTAFRRARMSRDVLLICAETLGLQELHWLSTVKWVTVKSIACEGECNVYDVSIADTHCFYASDVLMHNTWSLIRISNVALDNSKKVLFISSEMSWQRIAMRFAAMLAKVPYELVRRGKLRPDEEVRYRECLRTLRERYPNFHVYSPPRVRNVEDVGILLSEHKPDVLLIDGIYLLAKGGNSKDGKYYAVAEAIKTAKWLAEEKAIPCITTVQFNRQGGKDSSKTTSDLEEIAHCYEIGMTVDYMFGMFQSKDLQLNRQMVIKALKVRESDPTSDPFVTTWDLWGMDFTEIGSWDGERVQRYSDAVEKPHETIPF